MAIFRQLRNNPNVTWFLRGTRTSIYHHGPQGFLDIAANFHQPRDPRFCHSACGETWEHGFGNPSQRSSCGFVACSGCVRVHQVRETRPVVSGRHAFDWVLVLRALFGCMGLRPRCEGMSLIVVNECNGDITPTSPFNYIGRT
jgi:hypothetical protein